MTVPVPSPVVPQERRPKSLFTGWLGSQEADLPVLGSNSRSSVRQCLLFGVVTHPAESGDPGTFMTSAASPLSVKK